MGTITNQKQIEHQGFRVYCHNLPQGSNMQARQQLIGSVSPQNINSCFFDTKGNHVRIINWDEALGNGTIQCMGRELITCGSIHIFEYGKKIN